MRKIYVFTISLVFTFVSVFAQKVNVDIYKTETPPIIDGFVDDVWNSVTPVPVEKNFKEESPTITVTWQAMWDDTCFYVLVVVEDDDHYPSWEAGGETYLFDKVEIYFDVNEVLEDETSAGPSTGNSGHWQVAPGAKETGYDIENFEDGWDGHGADNYHSYSLTGENCTWEYRIPFAGLYDKAKTVMDVDKLLALEDIGFDVMVIDQDEGITVARNRLVWQNDGKDGVINAEPWGNMNMCGTITMKMPLVGLNNLQTTTFSVHPNPVMDVITIDTDFDKVVFANILGQETKTFNNVKTKQLNISDLAKGIYVVKVYKGNKILNNMKITKI